MNASQGRLARQQARRQRRERLTGIALAIVGVVVLVVAIVALRDPKNPSTKQAGAQATVTTTRTAGASTSPAPTRSSSSPPSGRTSASSATTTAAPPAAQLKHDFPLVVLNSTTIQGLAASAAQRFEDGGWTVSGTGNLVNDIISTCAYYDPDVANAQVAAEALQREYPTIQRVEPKFDGLVAGPVVVVLTTDYSSG